MVVSPAAFAQQRDPANSQNANPALPLLVLPDPVIDLKKLAPQGVSQTLLTVHDAYIMAVDYLCEKLKIQEVAVSSKQQLKTNKKMRTVAGAILDIFLFEQRLSPQGVKLSYVDLVSRLRNLFGRTFIIGCCKLLELCGLAESHQDGSDDRSNIWHVPRQRVVDALLEACSQQVVRSIQPKHKRTNIRNQPIPVTTNDSINDHANAIENGQNVPFGADTQFTTGKSSTGTDQDQNAGHRSQITQKTGKVNDAPFTNGVPSFTNERCNESESSESFTERRNDSDSDSDRLLKNLTRFIQSECLKWLRPDEIPQSDIEIGRLSRQCKIAAGQILYEIRPGDPFTCVSRTIEYSMIDQAFWSQNRRTFIFCFGLTREGKKHFIAMWHELNARRWLSSEERLQQENELNAQELRMQYWQLAMSQGERCGYSLDHLSEEEIIELGAEIAQIPATVTPYPTIVALFAEFQCQPIAIPAAPTPHDEEVSSPEEAREEFTSECSSSPEVLGMSQQEARELVSRISHDHPAAILKSDRQQDGSFLVGYQYSPSEWLIIQSPLQWPAIFEERKAKTRPLIDISWSCLSRIQPEPRLRSRRG